MCLPRQSKEMVQPADAVHLCHVAGLEGSLPRWWRDPAGTSFQILYIPYLHIYIYILHDVRSQQKRNWKYQKSCCGPGQKCCNPGSTCQSMGTGPMVLTHSQGLASFEAGKSPAPPQVHHPLIVIIIANHCYDYCDHKITPSFKNFTLLWQSEIFGYTKRVFPTFSHQLTVFNNKLACTKSTCGRSMSELLHSRESTFYTWQWDAVGMWNPKARSPTDLNGFPTQLNAHDRNKDWLKCFDLYRKQLNPAS